MTKNLYYKYAIIFCILILLIFISRNKESFYIHLAHNAEKHNNIESAINNYENAFYSGYKNTKDRLSYVNLLIKNDKGSYTQQKLTEFKNLNVFDEAYNVADDYLFDKEDEIREKFPKNYITQAHYNHKIMRWSDTPITYRFLNSEDAPEYFTEEIENAFNRWQNATEGKVSFKKVSNNPNIIIKYNLEQPSGAGGEKYIIAFTQPDTNGDTLKSMKIDFFIKDAEGNIFTQNHIYNTALHEIAHAIGFMGHSGLRENIMHSSADSYKVKNDIRTTLSQGDINTIKLLYSIKPEITDKKAQESEYTPEIATGNKDSVVKNKMKEAMEYIKKAPNLPSGYIDAAEGLIESKKYSNAIEYLNKALELSKSSKLMGMIYYNLAVAYYLSEDYSTAEECLKKAIILADSESNHALMAEIYTKKGEKNKAISMYNELIKSNPSNIEYAIDLTNIYVLDKKYVSARKVLRNFIKNNPSERNNIRFKPYGILTLFL